jgi:hypothetical protein
MDKKENHVDKENIDDGFEFKQILKFPFAFWIICLICVFYYAAIFPYIGSVKSFYMFKYGLSSYAANICNRYTIEIDDHYLISSCF